MDPDQVGRTRGAAWFFVAFLAVALLTVVNPVDAHAEDEAPHSPNVEAASHDPEAPERGVPVTVHVRLHDASNVTRISLIYCRAENYACGPSQPMDAEADGSYRGEIPWHPTFFQAARNVGYNLTIHYENTSKETSPLENWPYTPPTLPDGAGRYYFYGLPEEAQPIPGPTVALAAIAALAAAGWIGRGTRP